MGEHWLHHCDIKLHQVSSKLRRILRGEIILANGHGLYLESNALVCVSQLVFDDISLLLDSMLNSTKQECLVGGA